MLKDIRKEISEPVVIHCGNTRIVNISKNPLFHSKTKHISIKCYMLREKDAEKEFRLEYVSTKERIVYIFTKPLPKETLESLQGMLGVMPLPTSK